MVGKIKFQSKTEKELTPFLKEDKNRKILNFLNQHDLYQSSKEPTFKKTLVHPNSLNFIDGFTISAYFFLTRFKRTPRIRGPTFTKNFISDKELSQDKKHFFIGLEKEDLKKIKEKFPHLTKTKIYNPSFIKSLNFSKNEIDKMASMVNIFKPDYIWVGIGCPKQNILSVELFKRTNAQNFVNIGAALDFLLGKKKEAPLIVRELGIEWLYRLITDFKYSYKKVLRSFLGLKSLGKIDLENRSFKN